MKGVLAVPVHAGHIGVTSGYGYRAAVEEADDVDVRQLFDTNVFGAVDMVKAVPPDMRGRRSGSIVNISSIAPAAR